MSSRPSYSAEDGNDIAQLRVACQHLAHVARHVVVGLLLRKSALVTGVAPPIGLLHDCRQPGTTPSRKPHTGIAYPWLVRKLAHSGLD